MSGSNPTPPPTTVKAVRNGPLQLKGAFRVLDPDGGDYDLDGQRIVLLCRCGHSQNQPFCDSSHKRIGFESADTPPNPAADDLSGAGDGRAG
jgi:CDGSH-type Zn-finger protein